MTNRGESGGPGQAVNQADAKKRERSGGAAKEKIFQSGFGRMDIGFIESSQDIERQPKQLESDKNHEQLFAADEQHESHRAKQKHGDILAVITQRFLRGNERNSSDREREADNFKE